MLISMNWINDFVDLSGLDVEKLIHQFTLSTAEVEDVYFMGRDIENVVAAKIVSVEKYPDSKKLHLLKVDAGSEIVDVVRGMNISLADLPVLLQQLRAKAPTSGQVVPKSDAAPAGKGGDME